MKMGRIISRVIHPFAPVTLSQPVHAFTRLDYGQAQDLVEGAEAPGGYLCPGQAQDSQSQRGVWSIDNETYEVKRAA